MTPRAVPSGLGYRPALDGFRGVAILLVVLYHVRLLPGGALGVDMFFALSGLLITSILLAEWDLTGTIDLGRFYLRRVLRLVPALVVMVTTTYVVSHFVHPSLSGYLLDRWAAAALLYVTNMLTAYGREFPLGAVSIHWSLALEEQFYLAWPLCLRFLLRRGIPRRRLATLLALASLVPAVVRTALLQRGSVDPTIWLRIYFAPDTRADPLLAGCSLALLLADAPVRVGAAGLAASAGAVALGYLAATVQPLDAYPVLFMITALASSGVLYAVWAGGLWARALELSPLVWVGRLSYSLYLWHNEGLRIGSRWPLPLQLGAALALAATSYYLVERPFLKLKARFGAVTVARGDAGLPQTMWPLVARVAAGVAALIAMTSAGYGLLLNPRR